MFNQWINRISDSIKNGVDTSGASTVADVERISAALLVEIARADHVLDEEEIESITMALQGSSSLTIDELGGIVSGAVVDADAAVSLHEHVRLVNEHFDRDQKIQLLEQMWRVAAADGNIDQYEDYTIRKLSDLLYIRHSEFIQAKLRVIDQK